LYAAGSLPDWRRNENDLQVISCNVVSGLPRQRLCGYFRIDNAGVGRLVKHARYYWLMLAEGHLTRGRFAAMLQGIAMLPLPAS
jgi:hypothetical protein